MYLIQNPYSATFQITLNASRLKEVRIVKSIYTDKCFLSTLLLILHGFLTTSLLAQPLISNDPEPYFEIAGRIRNGDWAFESSLNIAVPTGQQGGGQWQMNPDGSPVWDSEGNHYGDIHTFIMTYTEATGTITWQIDFNRDGDYEGMQETKSMPVNWFADKGFTYINVYGQGNEAGLTASLTNLTVNNVYFGDFTSSSETPFSILLKDVSGVFHDIVVTGSFSLSGNGGFEQPRIWVRLGKPNKSPVCYLTYPLPGAHYDLLDTIQMKAIAYDPEGKIRRVEFYADNIKIGEDTKIPFLFTWYNIPPGAHKLTAKAIDNKGATTFSDPVNITYGDNISPTCAITNLQDSMKLFDPDTLLIEAIAADPDDGVQVVSFFRDSIMVGTDSLAPYTNVALLNPPMGMYTLSAQSTDFSGKSSTRQPVHITVRCIREDIDNNGTVNTVDFLLLLAVFGKNCISCREDFNEDGVVSTIDFLRLLTKIGYTCN
ncbi:MAG: Ig-like domain-containing protein [Saprospiraceae bacterium]|nr:Ig-like domain-containing protein [Saprospiraceae bacterium]